MKKGILSLLIVVFMIAMLAPAAFAAGTSVVVSDVNTTPGAEVTLNVSISGNPGFGAATIDIEYDEEVLTLTAIGVEGTLFGKGVGVQNVAKNRVNCASATAITGDGVLFTLTFKVADNAVSGEYDVSVSVKNFTDTKGTAIAASIEAGTVAVHKCEGTLVPAKEATCTETGNIAYYVCECGKLYADEACTEEITEADTVVGVVDHDWEWVTDKEATCGEAGEKHEECDCGAKRNEGTEIPATGDHDWEWVTDKEATTTEDGEKHEECKDCDTKRNEGTKIPAIGEVPPTGDNTIKYVIFAFVALVAFTGTCHITKKQENK